MDFKGFDGFEPIMCLYQIATQDFAFGVQGMEVLLFKDDLHPHRLQLAHRLESVHRIPGKAGDGFGEYEIYFVRLFDTM